MKKSLRNDTSQHDICAGRFDKDRKRGTIWCCQKTTDKKSRNGLKFSQNQFLYAANFSTLHNAHTTLRWQRRGAFYLFLSERFRRWSATSTLCTPRHPHRLTELPKVQIQDSKDFFNCLILVFATTVHAKKIFAEPLFWTFHMILSVLTRKSQPAIDSAVKGIIIN